MDKEIIIADNQDPQTRCAGDKSFDDCPTAAKLLELTDSFVRDPGRGSADGNYNILVLTEFTLGCVACANVCYMSRMIVDGLPTEPARIYCEPAILNIETNQSSRS